VKYNGDGEEVRGRGGERERGGADGEVLASIKLLSGGGLLLSYSVSSLAF
jgi:hypothetical protein